MSRARAGPVAPVSAETGTCGTGDNGNAKRGTSWTCVLAQTVTDYSVIDTVISSDEDRNRFAAVARALGDPKRLCVLESLADGEASVGDLAARVSCQVPNMSQHLAVLRSAGLVTARRDGSTVYYRLADPRVLEAYRVLQAIAR